jgi:Holliday junction resolvase RusA-like endonuclease
MSQIYERTFARNRISDDERVLRAETRLVPASGADAMNARPVTVVIAGEPVAKARPQVTRRGIAYTPAHTRKYEAHGRLAAQLAMGDRPPIEAPVRLELVAELPIPVSWSGRKRSLAVSGDVLPTCRPDVDNYVKAAIDSLNEIVVRDDSQIVEITARKRFSIAPKLVMTVFPLGPHARTGARNERACLHQPRRKSRQGQKYCGSW